MSKLVVIAAAFLSIAGVAAAQTATPPGAAPPPVAATTALTLDSPIEDIAANPAGKAVLDKDLPGLTTHPAYDQFKSMSLKEVEPMSQGAITDAMLAKTGTDLAALPK